MNILICQEEEIMLTALEFRLSKQGFEVSVAKDKKTAIAQIQEKQPDLVVADIMSDKVEGLDILEHLNGNGESKVPFVLISELDNTDLILEALNNGADDFIAKPFNPVELLIRIKRILHQY